VCGGFFFQANFELISVNCNVAEQASQDFDVFSIDKVSNTTS
jgi:hypothetical protein